MEASGTTPTTTGRALPLTITEYAADEEVKPRHVLAMAREHGVRMVDFKFTDLPGTTQHVTLSMNALEEEAFEAGLGFDGSSTSGSTRPSTRSTRSRGSGIGARGSATAATATATSATPCGPRRATSRRRP